MQDLNRILLFHRADAPISGHFWEYILFNDIKVLG